MPLFGPNTTRVDPAYVRLIRLLVRYHDDGSYGQDTAAVGRLALDFLNGAPGDVAHPALVLDIDETSLQNDWPRLLKVETRAAAGDHYSYYDASVWNQWVEEARARPIEVTSEIYRSARARSWDVFFITGRPSTQRAATEENLRRAGYDAWAEVICATEPT